MDIFLETYNLSKLYEEESENLNKQITPIEIEAISKNLPTNKSPDWMALHGFFLKKKKN